MNKILFFIFILLVTCGVAFSAGISSNENSTGFGDTDANSDGVLSLTELDPNSSLANKFADVDADNSGGISLQEYQLFHALAEAE